jgi:protoporphyrinogen oxidase
VERTRFLVVGAGVTGLSFAAHLGDDDYLVCEAEAEPGGYCRTLRRSGFTWDYSGHFFHFRHPDIEKWLVERMGSERVRTIVKDSRILYAGKFVDFPFQRNIHQLPFDEFLECLGDLFDRPAREEKSFEDMLYARFGRAICEKFLIPYNEKLYATTLSRLDVGAMGRFFPHADPIEIVRGFRRPDNASYNSTFTYPEGGAVQYIHALLTAVKPDRVSLNERVLSIDLDRRVARTERREIGFESLVSSTAFPRLLELAKVPFERDVYTWNKVLVYNLGFDRKGLPKVHWIYFPQRDLEFYRVGFYDNIFDSDRMSLYVEVGLNADAAVDATAVERGLERVLGDLRRTGIVTDQTLVDWHSVVLDPAYVHITERSIADTRARRAALAERGVYSLGRYGAWTYCSIEDNIVEARELAQRLVGVREPLVFSASASG